MDNRNEPTDLDLIDSPRRTPTPPPLSAYVPFRSFKVEETINLAVSDLASFPPCVSPGCPHHDSGLKIITPKKSQM
ncbi:hypothetical protein TNCV_757871 [Trichonephila clavipes]|nr:hypothetical protein TNCV_757871 [Trichonephila clavipes]